MRGRKSDHRGAARSSIVYDEHQPISHSSAKPRQSPIATTTMPLPDREAEAPRSISIDSKIETRTAERLAGDGPPTPNGDRPDKGSGHRQEPKRDVSTMTILELFRGPQQPDPAMRRSLSENFADLVREREAGRTPYRSDVGTHTRSLHVLYNGGSKRIH